MIDPIAGTVDTSVGLMTNEVPGGSLGKEEFLQLLIAQLQNQDPLSPLKADQLAVQLAQFTSVEQLISINDQIGALGAADVALADSVATSTAVGLIGKNVRAAVDQIAFDGSGSAVVDVFAPPAGGSATVRVFDSTGLEVASYDAGILSPGAQTLNLGVLDQKLPPGTYRLVVQVSDAAGNTIALPTTISGLVNGVRYDRNGPMLMIGLTEFPLSSVLEVRT